MTDIIADYAFKPPEHVLVELKSDDELWQHRVVLHNYGDGDVLIVCDHGGQVRFLKVLAKLLPTLVTTVFKLSGTRRIYNDHFGISRIGGYWYLVRDHISSYGPGFLS